MWRSILAKRRLHYLASLRRAATIIQAFERGSNARSWVKAWKAKRNYYIPRCQARIRQKLAARRWKETMELMKNSATCIQAFIRRFLAKCLAASVKCNRATITIQLFYRNIKCHRAMQTLKEYRSAALIQKRVRQRLTKKFVQKLSNEYQDASIKIQSCWRRHLAGVRLSLLLLEKYSIEAKNRILIINAEIAYYKEKLEQFQRSARDQEILEKIKEVENTIFETRQKLRTSQKNYQELERMKAQMTPTSVVEGWEEQVNQSLQYERQMQTTMKIDLVLKLGKELQVCKRQLNDSRASRSGLEQKIVGLQNDKEIFMARLRRAEQTRSKKEIALEFRKTVADEKRHWKVQHRRSNGKPMKGCAKISLSSQFSYGPISLFADREDQKDPRERIANMIALHSHALQENQLKRMLKPLQSLNK